MIYCLMSKVARMFTHPLTSMLRWIIVRGDSKCSSRILFSDFPPVLRLNLKRFENDLWDDTMIKINDHYKFPLQLDLDREEGKYLSPHADRSVRNLYILHSVVAHAGGVHSGHFHTYVTPSLSDEWFKFDDERVTREDVTRAFGELYGGEEEIPKIGSSNVCMLVYIRESDKEKIICDVVDEDIAEPLRMKLKNEMTEKKQKRKVKAKSHRIVKVARCEDIKEQIGKHMFFDLVDHDKVSTFCVERRMPVYLFKETIAEEFGVPVQFQRLWMWAKHENYIYRPHRPLASHEERHSVGQLREVNDHSLNDELRLFLEVELGQDLQAVPLQQKTKQDILLFLKFYDPLREELRYVGRLIVNKLGKPSEILIKLNKMAGLAPDQEIELYLEVEFKPIVVIEHLCKDYTFCASQLKDGDIVCFQKSLPIGSAAEYKFPDVPSFLKNCKGIRSN